MDVERHGDIARLVDEWAALHAADARATPYGSAAWCLAAGDGGGVVGLMAPARRRRAGMRVLRPLGDEHADCWDVLALPDARAEVERRLAEELRRRSGDWDA